MAHQHSTFIPHQANQSFYFIYTHIFSLTSTYFAGCAMLSSAGPSSPQWPPRSRTGTGWGWTGYALGCGVWWFSGCHALLLLLTLPGLDDFHQLVLHYASTMAEGASLKKPALSFIMVAMVLPGEWSQPAWLDWGQGPKHMWVLRRGHEERCACVGPGASMEKKCKKAKWLSEEALRIAVKRREVKSKGEKERYTHLNAEFQRIANGDSLKNWK